MLSSNLEPFMAFQPETSGPCYDVSPLAPLLSNQISKHVQKFWFLTKSFSDLVQVATLVPSLLATCFRIQFRCYKWLLNACFQWSDSVLKQHCQLQVKIRKVASEILFELSRIWPNNKFLAYLRCLAFGMWDKVEALSCCTQLQLSIDQTTTNQDKNLKTFKTRVMVSKPLMRT